MTQNKGLSLIAALVLALSVPFLLHIKQCRYYALLAVFTSLALYFYLGILKKDKKSTYLFALSAVGLFYSAYLVFLGTMVGVYLHFLMFYFKKYYRELIKASLIIIVLTLPWLIFFMPSASSITTNVFIIRHFLNLFLNYLSQINFYIFPLILLLFVPFILLAKDKTKIVFKKDYFLIFLVTLTVIIFASIAPSWSFQRYMVGIIPLLAIIVAFCFNLIKKYSLFLAIIFLVIMLFTNLFNIFPVPFLKLVKIKTERLSAFCQDNHDVEKLANATKPHSYLYDYLTEISFDYHGPVEGLVTYLQNNGKEGEVVFTDLDASAIMFYTPLKAVYSIDYLQDKLGTTEWIVIRNPAIDRKLDKRKIDELYEKIYIDYPNNFIDNIPELSVHKFETVDKEGFFIYHKKNKT